MRTLARYALVLLLLVLAGCLLLLLAGLVPQQAVQANLSASMDQLVLEGMSPGVLYDGHPRSTLDNFSEAHILLHSFYMDTRTDAAAILENPGYTLPGGADAPEAQLPAYQTAIDASIPANATYVRYWMGFRAIVRPLLAIMNHMDARQLLLWSFLLLLGAIALQLYRRTGAFWLSLAFVFAMSQLNPIAITGCFQFSICFLIAFIGMLLALNLRFQRLPAPMLFFILGACTQYFDFYTAPLLTFGLPMLALLLRLQYRKEADPPLKLGVRLVLGCFAAWMSAYLLMWLSKLALTSALTPIDAFADAFDRVRLWLIEPAQDAASDASVPRALFYCAINMTDPLPLVLEGMLLLAYAVSLLVRRPPRAVFARNLPYLLVGLLPLLWIAATYAPSYHHAYFQYRILGVTMYAGLIYLINTGWASHEHVDAGNAA